MDATKLASFVDPLPLPELQRPQGKRSSTIHGAVDATYYPIHIREIACKLHRDLPPSRMWGYGATSAPVLFDVQSNDGVLIEWINELPAHHILSLDPPLRGMEGAPETRTVTHVHGAHVPSISDGYPEDWFDAGQSKLCFYPNRQEAASLWAHDHAMGVSRLNTHPIHLHTVRFQILDRRNFSVDDYLSDETLRYTGPTIPPKPYEMGWTWCNALRERSRGSSFHSRASLAATYGIATFWSTKQTI